MSLQIMFFFILILHHLPNYPLFPYTTLFRSDDGLIELRAGAAAQLLQGESAPRRIAVRAVGGHRLERVGHEDDADRKSTRLNSSHPSNSYAVFCLKKKT